MHAVAQTIEIIDEPPDSTRLAACLEAYYEELARRFEGGFDPGETSYAHPKRAAETRHVIALRGGEAVGCGSLLLDGSPCGEIKRMWVARQARRLGVARHLLGRLEALGKEYGLARIRLDTNKALPEARALYISAGYSEIPRYSENPYAHFWFGKEL